MAVQAAGRVLYTESIRIMSDASFMTPSTVTPLSEPDLSASQRAQPGSVPRHLPRWLAALMTNDRLRYPAALAATAIALFGRWLLIPALGDHVPFAMVYGAVGFSAIVLGLGPSISSSVFAFLGVRLLFAAHPFRLSSLSELSETITYTGACILVITTTEMTRRWKNRLAVANCELALHNRELEERVQERTADLQRAEASARHLGGQILKMQDEERRRIACELHDSVGQSVAVLNLNLGQLRRSPNLKGRDLEIISEIKSIASGVADEVRTISHLLHPPLLDEMGLPAALRWYVGEFAKRSGIRAELELSEDFDRMAADCEIAIFRIVQEALVNVLRHSGSPSVAVRVDWTSSTSVTLEIADEGTGISAEKLRAFATGAPMGVGIHGMRERVDQLGGRLELHSSARGTTVRVELPFA